MLTLIPWRSECKKSDQEDGKGRNIFRAQWAEHNELGGSYVRALSEVKGRERRETRPTCIHSPYISFYGDTINLLRAVVDIQQILLAIREGGFVPQWKIKTLLIGVVNGDWLEWIHTLLHYLDVVKRSSTRAVC